MTTLATPNSSATADVGRGDVWTRTGRSFFDDSLTHVLLDRLRRVVESVGLFDGLSRS
ncbi:hypothetical protein [Jatrophihabitans fulvus]